MKKSIPRIKTVSVSELVDKPVAGIEMQVTNVRYLYRGSEIKPKWRTMKRIYSKDNRINWEWEPDAYNNGRFDCGFSGSGEDSQGFPKIQLNLVDYNKLMKGKK